MSAPISLRLLVHSCSSETYTGQANGGPAYASPAIAMSRVRLEPVRRLANASTGDAKDDKFTLFYDARLSLPAGHVFGIKDRITFDGQKLSVRQVVPCYGNSAAVHHYEVYCV